MPGEAERRPARLAAMAISGASLVEGGEGHLAFSPAPISKYPQPHPAEVVEAAARRGVDLVGDTPTGEAALAAIHLAGGRCQLLPPGASWVCHPTGTSHPGAAPLFCADLQEAMRANLDGSSTRRRVATMASGIPPSNA